MLRLLAFALMLLAGSLWAVRLLAPLAVEHYQSDLVQTLSQRLRQPVEIEQVRLSWWGWQPVIHFNGLTLGYGSQQIHAPSGRIGLDIIQSALQGRAQFSHIDVQLDRAQWRWPAAGAQATPSVVLSDWTRWLFAAQALEVTAQQLVLIDHQDKIKLHAQARLSLRTVDTGRRLDAEFKTPDRQQLVVTVDARSFDDADFYLQGSGLQVLAWSSSSESTPGHASAALWGQWRHGTWERMDGRITQLRLQHFPAFIATLAAPAATAAAG